MLRFFASLYGITLEDPSSSAVSNNLQLISRLIAKHGHCLNFNYFQAVKSEREAEMIWLTKQRYEPLASMKTFQLFKINEYFYEDRIEIYFYSWILSLKKVALKYD